jgi:hypothetical protein
MDVVELVEVPLQVNVEIDSVNLERVVPTAL